MSVINRMLQELESRHEEPQARLPGMVRAVPPPRHGYRGPLLLLGLFVLGGSLGGLAFWLLQDDATPAQPERIAVGPVSAPMPAPQPAWPENLEAPTEMLLSETALASPPPSAMPVAAKPSPIVKAVADKTTTASAQVAPPAPILKSMPGSAEGQSAAGIKQISPAQRADQSYREALAFRAQGRLAEAQSLLDEALRIDPRHLGARQALLGMLVEGNHLARAEQLLQDGLALNIAVPALSMALARLQTERGDQAGALRTLEQRLGQAQGSADFHAFYAALLQRAERHGEAVGQYQAALREEPSRALWWMGLGISLQAEKKTGEAEQAYHRARATPGLSPELRAFVEQRLKQLQ